MCFYIIDVWCSKAVRFDGQCLPDVEGLMQSCQPFNHHYLDGAVYTDRAANLKKKALCIRVHVLYIMFINNCILYVLCEEKLSFDYATLCC